jgi:cell division protein FtsQ
VTGRLSGFPYRYKVAIALFAFMLISGSIVYELREFNREINYISVTGDVSSVQRSSITQTLIFMDGSLSDIEHVKEVLTGFGWIKSADIALRWPDELVIHVQPQQAIAYWNDNAFISGEGVVFEAEELVGGDLPQLYGPAGTEKVVMENYQRLNRALLKSGHFIEMLALNERGSLEFENQQGVRVSLGNIDVKQRLQRYLKVSAKIEELELTARRIDTRYANGVAVDFAEAEDFNIAETFKLQREVSL